ncbi:MAG: hypothetical protein F4Y49_09750 [Dehalococcoidia bacterium]|nr:hypothetical protein [Dehalococcoidia bacterium]MYA61152.1 hypothetical protein [Dehalococcoidia bacterium]
METIRRPLAVILGVITIAVAFHFIFSTFYPDSVDVGQVWDILDWFMAFAVLVTLVLAYMRKKNMTSDSMDAKMYVRVNLVFYSALWLAIWFFWNWFDNLASGAELQDDIHLTLWAFIDPLFIIVVGRLSVRLWKGDSR